ncbi:hypothetical protein HBI56_189280 [Parastagonospora nodorum]|uniref:Uncharacterized protein n=2 Tax=Phaeosphaeria nodorum (strain SN15 / ATCC MYA-4574 / FGSC 10173) TaxID=321614 RepID=A0A7U2FEB9_PHANO|nr:hypothetical protein SNOG_12026 [Parastagonospora nodorum SN15]KAH3910711.1 hypothetical protein HBH56_145200 [Parastagonospora nodorum]EAT80438.1 hypothetical protein SNOG_12026 [Parastagonospora nodorum SN15]KAH3927678.1 hypothetical protein HBH54_150390 [Parastagonospora nodorum]KAH3948074.1 hypothetical protein HBH53_110410 [Parastagonospora nodorum]KAH3960160.1 hypothetical protein HBH51_194250 [Parastagonospora nodorum]
MTTWRCSRFILVNGSWCRKAKGADGQQRTVETGESRRTNTGDRNPALGHPPPPVAAESAPWATPAD